MRGGGRHALLHVAIEFRARRIDGVAGMDEPGIGAETSHQIVDRLVAPYRGGERPAALCSAGDFGKLAFIIGFESDAVGIDLAEIALDRRIVETGIKVVEIPFRQGARQGTTPCPARPGWTRFQFAVWRLSCL